jgi:acyl carrier protein
VLRLAADRFDADTSLVTLGLDSLMAIALRNRLQRELALEIPTTVMWTHPTAAVLTGYLPARLHPQDQHREATTSAAEAVGATSTVHS